MSQMPPYPPGDPNGPPEPYGMTPPPPPPIQQPAYAQNTQYGMPYGAPTGQPMEYYTGPRRPTSVTVLAIIGIVWGILALICNGAVMIPYVVPLNQPNPVVDEVKANSGLLAWTVGSNVLRILLSFFLIVGCIGLLKLQNWARAGLRGYAVMMIVLAVIDTVVTIMWIGPITKNATMNGGTTSAAWQTGFYIGLVFGIALALAYPICLLAILARPHVKAAFGIGAPQYPYNQPWSGQAM